METRTVKPATPEEIAAAQMRILRATLSFSRNALEQRDQTYPAPNPLNTKP